MKVEWQQKVWGRTRCIKRLPYSEMHELEIAQCGFCSIHEHTKFNLFLCLDGDMIVESFDANGQKTSEQVLSRKHPICVIAPGVRHRFLAKTAAHCIELYWVRAIDPEDIKRYSEGGMAPSDAFGNLLAGGGI